MSRSSRRGERGQALVLALLTLFFTALAASLVAMDLGIRQRAMRDEAVRAHLRAQLDGALAEVLARLANRSGPGPVVVREARPGVEARYGSLPVRTQANGMVDVTVWATWGGRPAAAAAEVLVEPGRPPRVLAWRRLPAATAVGLVE